VRNLVRLPDGRGHWPLGLGMIRAVEAITPAQHVQQASGSIELRVLLARALTSTEELQTSELVRKALGYPFGVLNRPVPSIERGPGGKLEEFLSLTEA